MQQMAVLQASTAMHLLHAGANMLLMQTGMLASAAAVTETLAELADELKKFAWPSVRLLISRVEVAPPALAPSVTSPPLRSEKPWRYHRAADEKPTSSNSGGCNRWEIVRVSVMD